MLKIGEQTFKSRLLLGTGKYPSFEIQKEAVEVSEAEILTFAVRRMNIFEESQPNFLEQLDLSRYKLLPNTAGAKTAEEAVRIANLARASGLCDMIKVEVIGCDRSLLPDPIETLKASEQLLKEGFIVLTYTSDDVVLAKRLEELGVHAIMPGASPIGSGKGILNPLNLKFIIEQSSVPVIIDAGIGAPKDAAYAMELGADGVLLNTAVSNAKDPVKMASAMKLAIEAGRLGFEAGRMEEKDYAEASSPAEGNGDILTERYSRQELFTPIGKEGQANIQKAHVLIIGAGALGTASAEMLARAGVGTLTIVDRDYVEESNLQRQQLYKEEDARNQWPKAVAAQKRLQEINSQITVNGLVADVTGQNIEELVKGTNVIVDATDNFETRLIVNDAAVKHSIPFLFGACVASYGLTFPVIPGKTPCLHCLIQHLPSQSMTCDTAGVISPIVQMVAAIQVTHAFKLLTGYPLSASLQSIDIWTNEKAEINVEGLINADCPTCSTSAEYPYLAYENHTKADVLCGRNTIQIRPGMNRALSLEHLTKQLKEFADNVKANSYLLSCSLEGHRIVFFKDGRALIHGTNDSSRARSLYNRIIG